MPNEKNKISVIIDIVSPNANRTTSDVAKGIENIGKSAKIAADDFKPLITRYRDIDDAERRTTSIVSAEENKKKLARQIAAKEAYEAEQKYERQRTAAFEAGRRRRIADEKKMVAELEADLKKYQQSSLHSDEVLKQAAKSLADYQIKESKRVNQEELNNLKYKQSQSKPGSITSQTAAGTFLGNIGSSAVGELVSIIQSIPGYAESAAKSLFNLAKEAADYAGVIASAETKTGLTAETLSTLRFAAQESGKDFSDLERPLIMFTRLLGEAEKGSDSAQTKLKALGVTNFNNLDQSLEQVFKRIYNLQNPVQKITAASDAFGSRLGAQLIPIIQKTGGNFDEFKKKVGELGLVMSEDQVKAAREFNLAYNKVSAQIKGLTMQFGIELAPAITRGSDSLSVFLTSHKGEFGEFGKEIGNLISGISVLLGKLSELGSWKPYKTADSIGSAALQIINMPFYATGVALQSLGVMGRTAPTTPTPTTVYDPTTGKTISNPALGRTYDPTTGKYFSNKGPIGSKPSGGDDTSYTGEFDLGKGGGGGGRSKSGRSLEKELSAFADSSTMARYTNAVRKLPDSLKQQILDTADQYGIPQALALAQIFTESTFKTDARSPFNKNVYGPGKGDYAYGLTQVLPGTANQVLHRKDITGQMLKSEPQLALNIWGRYMTSLFNRYDGDWELAVLAYHQGPDKVDKLVRLIKQGSPNAIKALGKQGIIYDKEIKALSGLSGDAQFKLSSETDPDAAKKRQELETAKAILLNAQEVYGKEAVKIPIAVQDIIDAANEVKTWTRQRLAQEYNGFSIAGGRGNAEGDGVTFTPKDNSKFDDLLGNYRNQVESASRGGQKETNLEKAHQQLLALGDDYGLLTEAQKEQILTLAKQADAYDESTEAAKKLDEQQKQLFDKTTNFFEKTINTLRQGGFKSLFKEWLGDIESFLTKAASKFLASKLLKILNPQSAGGQQNQGVGLFDSIKNFFNLGSQGGNGSNSSGGGLFSGSQGNGIFNFGNSSTLDQVIQGAGKKALLGGNSGGGGLLSRSPIGGLLSKIPGLGSLFGVGAASATTGLGAGLIGGGALGAGSAGVGAGLIGGGASGAAGSAGLLSSIAPLLTNPWTIGIGAAIGGFFLLRHFLGGGEVKKLHDAIKGKYGLDVKDKSVMDSIDKIGKQFYGSKVGDHISDVLNLPDVQNILREYSTQSGQKSSLGPSQTDLANPDWSGNRFIKLAGARASGGPVFKNQSYIVGEYRPEVFTPNTNGFISPSTNGFQNSTNVPNDLLKQLIFHLQISSNASMAVQEAVSTIKAVPVGHVFTQGLKEHEDKLGDAVINQFSSRSDLTNKLNYQTGNV